MSLLNIFDIAGSGMSAQNLRLNITASNIANAESVTSSAADAYKSRQPVFSTAMNTALDNPGRAVGVRVAGIVESRVEHSKQYTPGHPYADENGYIYHSNVNIVEEMTNMIAASRNYQNNIEIMNTSKQLLIRTLELGE